MASYDLAERDEEGCVDIISKSNDGERHKAKVFLPHSCEDSHIDGQLRRPRVCFYYLYHLKPFIVGWISWCPYIRARREKNRCLGIMGILLHI